MKSQFSQRLIMDLHHDVVAGAVTINTLRRDLAEANARAQEAVVREAEAEAPLKALNEFTDYLIKRTREEREALREPNAWGRTVVGNAVGHTIYADLCAQLDKVRTSYGL